MRMSDIVSQRILELLTTSSDGCAEICRNEMAEALGCVPSQINYVLSSRFTPEHGYVVESRRGGGGYIRITRIRMDRSSAVMHLINSIGGEIDEPTAAAVIENLAQQQIMSPDTAGAMAAAMSDRCYRGIPPKTRDALRAVILKQMLLTTIL